MRRFALILFLLLMPLPAWAAEMVETKLYFGLTTSDGVPVLKVQWKDFVAEQVSPRFPQGFTVVNAKGQWQDRTGKLVRENTRLLIIVHEKSEKAAQDIAALKAIYIKRFKQSSVFHTESPVRVVE